MISPLNNRNTNKSLTSKDHLWLKHNFIMIYGWDCWKDIGLDEFFDLLPEMQKEIAKRENLRLSTLKYYGVKNPK